MDLLSDCSMINNFKSHFNRTGIRYKKCNQFCYFRE